MHANLRPKQWIPSEVALKAALSEVHAVLSRQGAWMSK